MLEAGGAEGLQKTSLNALLSKHGMIFENNSALNETQMEKIISARLKKETAENHAIFYSGIPSAKPIKLSLKTSFEAESSVVSHPNDGGSSVDRSRSFSQIS